MVDITIVNGVYKPTYNYGAPPCNYEPLQIMRLMWVKHCHKPPMTGNGKRITY